MKPAWTYEIRADRLRHRRGFYYDCYALVRNDTKVVATDVELAVVQATKKRFEAWANQPWR